MIPEGLSDTYRKCNMPKRTYTDKHTKKYRSALQPVLLSFHKIVLFYAKYRIDVCFYQLSNCSKVSSPFLYFFLDESVEMTSL